MKRNRKKNIQEEKIGIDLSGTVWIQQPFSEFPNCIDTLVLFSKNQGYRYSCEHEVSDSITYEINNSLLLVNVWKYKSEVNANAGKEIQNKYFMEVNDSSLTMTDIKHLWHGGEFKSVDPKYLNQVYYRIK